MEKLIELKILYGVENLDFWETRRGWCCRYISDPTNFDESNSLSVGSLSFLLLALSTQQGKIFFQDCGRVVSGMDELKAEYLPMKLAGL